VPISFSRGRVVESWSTGSFSRNIKLESRIFKLIGTSTVHAPTSSPGDYAYPSNGADTTRSQSQPNFRQPDGRNLRTRSTHTQQRAGGRKLEHGKFLQEYQTGIPLRALNLNQISDSQTVLVPISLKMRDSSLIFLEKLPVLQLSTTRPLLGMRRTGTKITLVTHRIFKLIGTSTVWLSEIWLRLRARSVRPVGGIRVVRCWCQSV
jgi:hypothetical protein